MSDDVFQSGPFKGVKTTDRFAQGALGQQPIVVSLPPIEWPEGLAPTMASLGGYVPGAAITGAVAAEADVLVVLYTDQEISAFLEVFTGDSTWNTVRKQTWNPYAHNFAAFKSSIQGMSGDGALEAGEFGYLAALTVGTTRVVLFKTELHPKTNGPEIPFIPVLAMLVGELNPSLVISTGTAGAIGPNIKCGDVIVVDSARFHLKNSYPSYPELNSLSSSGGQLTNSVTIDTTQIAYAASNFTKLSLPGLGQCYEQFQGKAQYGFLQPPPGNPNIYVTGINPVPGSQPMDIVSADYLTVDDSQDLEKLQALGAMNETDDAFASYAISTLPTDQQPKWLSIRNASEPQIVGPPSATIEEVTSLAGAIYGVFQYCTTLNSAFACWGAIAGLSAA